MSKFKYNNINPNQRDDVDFDRTEYETLSNRQIACNHEAYFVHSIDRNGAVWWWDNEDNIWYRVDDDNESLLIQDNALFFEVSKHALDSIYAFIGTHSLDAQMQAAFALQRAADILSDRWRRYHHTCNWRWSAGGLYNAITLRCAWQFVGLALPRYNDQIQRELDALIPSQIWFSAERCLEYDRKGFSPLDFPQLF